MRPTAGLTFGGRYELQSRIAIGGMGEVWQGYDESLMRSVAVKVLRDEYAGNAGFLARFRVEARNCAALSHPNIATLLDYGEQGGTAYLVMELVKGEPLSDVLERTPILTPEHLLPILAQTARGLAAAHEAGVVHRDIKPGNILIARGGRVKITDFGVSRAPGQPTMTDSGMVMGTAQYLSPEQAVGQLATSLSDLYALGVVAYEALVGHRPFTGPTPVDIAVAHVNQSVPPLPETVDPALGTLVMRLLNKDPARRPQSAEELAVLFDGLLASTPPSGEPVVSPAGTPGHTGTPGTPGTPGDAGGAARPAAHGDGDPAMPAPPPAFPPHRVTRPSLAPRTPAARHGAGPVPASPQAVGRRLGRWRWPVVIGGLLLLLLLGAWAASHFTSAEGTATVQQLVLDQTRRVRIVTQVSDQ